MEVETKHLKEVGQLGLGLRDPVLDFIAGAYGKIQADVVAVIEKNLRWMIEKFMACQGQFFLFIRREKNSCFRGDPGCFPSHDFSVLKTNLYLTIIGGEFRFGFGEGGTPFRFPIQSPYAVSDLYGEPTLHTGKWFEPTDMCGYEVMQFLKKPRQVSDIDQEQSGLDIAVGDEEVKELIRQYRGILDKHHGIFPLLTPVCKMSLLLKRFLRDFPEQDELFKKDKELFKEVWEVMGK